jgi:hypothetical protein
MYSLCEVTNELESDEYKIKKCVNRAVQVARSANADTPFNSIVRNSVKSRLIEC